MSEVTNKTM